MKIKKMRIWLIGILFLLLIVLAVIPRRWVGAASVEGFQLNPPETIKCTARQMLGTRYWFCQNQNHLDDLLLGPLNSSSVVSLYNGIGKTWNEAANELFKSMVGSNYNFDGIEMGVKWIWKPLSFFSSTPTSLTFTKKNFHVNREGNIPAKIFILKNGTVHNNDDITVKVNNTVIEQFNTGTANPSIITFPKGTVVRPYFYSGIQLRDVWDINMNSIEVTVNNVNDSTGIFIVCLLNIGDGVPGNNSVLFKSDSSWKVDDGVVDVLLANGINLYPTSFIDSIKAKFKTDLEIDYDHAAMNAKWIWTSSRALTYEPNTGYIDFVRKYNNTSNDPITGKLFVVADDFVKVSIQYAGSTTFTLLSDSTGKNEFQGTTITNPGFFALVTFPKGETILKFSARNKEGPAGLFVVCLQKSSISNLNNTVLFVSNDTSGDDPSKWTATYQDDSKFVYVNPEDVVCVKKSKDSTLYACRKPELALGERDPRQPLQRTHRSICDPLIKKRTQIYKEVLNTEKLKCSIGDISTFLTSSRPNIDKLKTNFPSELNFIDAKKGVIDTNTTELNTYQQNEVNKLFAENLKSIAELTNVIVAMGCEDENETDYTGRCRPGDDKRKRDGILTKYKNEYGLDVYVEPELSSGGCPATSNRICPLAKETCDK